MIEFSASDALLQFLDSERIRPERVELTPIDGVNEVLGWVKDRRPFLWAHRWSWASAIRDALAALSLLGPELRALLGVDLVRAEQSLSSMVPIVKSPTAADRAAARASLEALHVRFHDAATRTAAWEDLADAAVNHAVDADEAAWRDRALQEAVRVTGHDFKGFIWSARGIMQDRALDVAVAQVRLGERADLGHPLPSHNDDSGLSEAERLDLCRRLLQAPAIIGHQVVWVAFEDASLDQIQFDVGPVRFFDGQWVRAVLAHPEGPNHSTLPSELTAESEMGPAPLPDGEHVVLARVDLGERFATTAVDVAKTVASSLVAVAQQTGRSQRWSLVDGHLHAVDGQLRGWSSFGFEGAGRHYAAWTDQTGVDLQSLPANLADALPASPGSRLEQVLDAVSWYGESSERQDAFVHVLLGVRVLELVSSWLPGAPKWHEMASDYYAAWWARQELVLEAYYATHEALHRSTVDSLASDSDQEKLRTLASRIITRSSARSRTEMDQAIEALAQLDNIYPPTSSVGRQVRRAAASTASGRAAFARIEHHKARFAVLLDRLQRCRNSIAHGGPLSVAVASTTTEFAQTLCRTSLRRALEAEATGTTIETVLADHRDGAERIVAALAANTPPAAALFTP